MKQVKQHSTDPSNEIVQTKLEVQAEKATRHHNEANKKTSQPRSHYITTKIKDERYLQTIRQTQATLPKTDKYISKFIHQKQIYSTTDFLEKTILRPYTLLIDAMLTLVLGMIAIYWSSQVGIDYQATIFIAIFILLYPLCLVIDLAVSMVQKSKKH